MQNHQTFELNGRQHKLARNIYTDAFLNDFPEYANTSNWGSSAVISLLTAASKAYDSDADWATELLYAEPVEFQQFLDSVLPFLFPASADAEAE